MSNGSRLARFSFCSPARFFAPSTVPPLPATTRPKSYLYVGVRPPSFQFDSFTRRTMYRPAPVPDRSEEHTSELQSQSNLVCRLLLEKKKKKENKSSS